MVHTGRKMCGSARRLAKRARAPDARSVPYTGTRAPYETHGTANVAKMTREERRMIDAWDNAGNTGETIYWDRVRHYTRIRMMARRSGMHVHDGPAAHDVRPLDGTTIHNTPSRSAREFVRQLNIERMNS